MPRTPVFVTEKLTATGWETTVAAPIHDATAQTEPLTVGQRIVAGYETDLISEPCEYAAAIDAAIAAEREACASIAEFGTPECDWHPHSIAGQQGKKIAELIRARNER